MSDEDVDIDEGTPIEIELGAGSALVVDLGALPSLDVALVPPAASAADLSSAPSASVELQSVAPIDVSPDEIDPVEVILAAIMGLTAEQLEKLNSIARGARNQQPDFIKLVDLVEVSSSTPGSVGDSIPWYGTTSYQEIGGETIIEHAFRDSGWILLQAAATFTDSRTVPGALMASFTIETAPKPASGVVDNPATRGLPLAYTVHETFQSTPIAATTDMGTLFFVVAIHAGGHTAATWFQYYDGYFKATAIPRASPKNDTWQPLADVIPVPIDPRKRNRYRMQFKAVALASVAVTLANWDEATKAILDVGAFAGWTPLPGEQLVITAGTGVVLGTYYIASKTSDNEIRLTASIMGGAPGNVVDNSINGTIQVQHLDVRFARITLLHPRDHVGY